MKSKYASLFCTMQCFAVIIRKIKRPKSLEDNLIEVHLDYQSRCLSRFNSVKRKQLERMRQRSDWFLNSDTSFSNGNRSSPTSALHCSSHRRRRRRRPSYCSDENGGSESIAGNSHRQPSSGEHFFSLK